MINHFTRDFQSGVYTRILLFYHTILAFKVCDTMKKNLLKFY